MVVRDFVIVPLGVEPQRRQRIGGVALLGGLILRRERAKTAPARGESQGRLRQFVWVTYAAGNSHRGHSFR